MVPVTILLIPVIAASILGFFYGPAVLALNPGNEIMTASDHTFQSDTFSLTGTIGSLVTSSSPQEPYIVTGAWALDVAAANASGFLADLEIINVNGSHYHTIQLANLTSNDIELHDNGTTTITGAVNVFRNETDSIPADASITVTKLKTIKIVLDTANPADVFSGQPIYGIADQPQLETVSAMVEQESGFGLDNITEKFQLPELPNPFR
jgi:hypothetical protein